MQHSMSQCGDPDQEPGPVGGDASYYSRRHSYQPETGLERIPTQTAKRQSISVGFNRAPGSPIAPSRSTPVQTILKTPRRTAHNVDETARDQRGVHHVPSEDQPTATDKSNMMLHSISTDTASRRLNALSLVAQDVRDRGDQHNSLLALLPMIESNTADPAQRARLVQCGWVTTLIGCIQDVPSADLRRAVVLRLAALTTDLFRYPTAINDTHFQDIMSLLTEHTEHMVEGLKIVRELTKFRQGRNLACANNVPKVVAKITSVMHHDEIVIPALQVLCNIAQDTSCCQAILDTDIVTSGFENAIARRLLRHFQQPLSYQDPDGITPACVWRFAMFIDDEDSCLRQQRFYKVIQQCGSFCRAALSHAHDYMLHWVTLMQLCTRTRDLTRSAIEHGFLLSANVILRYGRDDSFHSFVETLKRMAANGDPKHSSRMVSAGIVHILLERVPDIWSILHSGEPQANLGAFETHRAANYETVVIIVELIKDILRDLPAEQDELPYHNSVIDTVYRSFSGLATLSMTDPLKTTLHDLFTVLDDLMNGSRQHG